ncbi:MAG TPA: hypothetical protein VM618_04095 [Acidimicrobiia bacterium]|nr:hypothetical protein [Acidimicrobiia bacterium]
MNDTHTQTNGETAATGDTDVTHDTAETARRRRPRSGTVVALIFAIAAMTMFAGYFLTPDPRCALGVADEARYENATVEGNTRWNWWPPGWTTVCRAFDADGNEIPYVPYER